MFGLTSTLKILGFTRIIKIPGKGFEDLSWPEFALMIDAFLDGDNEAFDAIALSEFVNWRAKRPDLQALQRKISANWLLSADYEENPPLNEVFLRDLASSLRSGDYTPTQA